MEDFFSVSATFSFTKFIIKCFWMVVGVFDVLVRKLKLYSSQQIGISYLSLRLSKNDLKSRCSYGSRKVVLLSLVRLFEFVSCIFSR